MRTKLGMCQTCHSKCYSFSQHLSPNALFPMAKKSGAGRQPVEAEVTAHSPATFLSDKNESRNLANSTLQENLE